mmetsp:Transcript_24201/g.81586  ORF Transcript_24201/g.81586 Transcript_24201/m.81586 type:complete len:862 (+) Transcript_24201:205-2790(+)
MDPAGFDASGSSESKELFGAFLDSEFGGVYEKRLHDMALEVDGRKSQRLLINVNDVRRFDGDLATKLLQQPLNFLAPWTELVHDRLRSYGAGDARTDPARAARLVRAGGNVALAARSHLGFVGAFGSHLVNPRELRAAALGSMVCVEGIVTRCSLSQPKVVRSVHWCEATQQHTTREYRDSTALDLAGGGPGASRVPQTSGAYPKRDAEGNALETEFGLGVYKDHQQLTIQEPPERAPLGQLPRSVDVYVDDDLVDAVKPGDRVRCAGVYRALGGGGGKNTSGSFKTVVLANSLATRGTDSAAVALTARDVENIKAVAVLVEEERPRRDRDFATGFGRMLRALAAAFSPSIFGHDQIKMALVMQLIGGAEKNLVGGTRLRGDINILLVGDPSTAKSQLLRATMRQAPLAVSTTGRGSSGVGLTAAISHDPETGDRRLEAGAVVLADRGVVCIDEFDKMSSGDRVAIHEVMEQQTVTLAKAGIHASLNARCAVLAAANPVYGQYDADRRPNENVGLPDSLLSRFDLLFIVLDNVDADSDRRVADHVLKSHRYRRVATDTAPEPLNADYDKRAFDSFRGAHAATNTDSKLAANDAGRDFRDDGTSPVWTAAAAAKPKGGSPTKKRRLQRESLEGDKPKLELPASGEVTLHADFVRKYVHYARHQVEPELSDDARESIAHAYADLRAKADDRTLPVTARCLESLIRLSTAHAKARLSTVIEDRDCAAALELMSFALYGDTLQADPTDDAAEAEYEDEDDDDDCMVDETQEDTEASFICPITQKIMDVPMKSKKCGHSYSKEAVEGYFKGGEGKKCAHPGCNQKLGSADFDRDFEKDAAIKRFKSREKAQQKATKASQKEDEDPM